MLPLCQPSTCLLILVWLYAANFLPLGGAAAESPSPVPPSHALLVGCTRYPLNERIPELWGPANDVPAFAKLLNQRFGFAQENIHQLVGWGEDPASRPTYANISAAFEKLIARAEPGAQVVILMSGHGTQIPIPAAQSLALDPSNPEHDGLDEVFLPADVKPWSGGHPENALFDDQLGAWLDQLQSRGAAVWIVFDCCHSGTMTRAVEVAERQRGVTPQALGVPDSALKSAAEKRVNAVQASEAERSRDAMISEVDAIDLTSDPAAASTQGSITAFYASQAFETAPELPRPADAPRTPENYFGLLSYVLIQTFESSESPTAALSYRDLGRQIVARYRSERGSRSPTPFFSGDLDREVLGSGRFSERSSMVLQHVDQIWQVDAGEWRGLAPETILAVFAPDDRNRDDSDILGYLRVVKVTPSSSEVQGCEYAGRAEVPLEQFPALARCVVVYQALGDMRLKVAVESSPEQPLPDAATELSDAIGSLPQEIAALVQWVDVADAPQWRLRTVSPAVAEQRYGVKTEQPTVLLVDASRVYGPYPLGDSRALARRLGVDLQKLFTWQNTWRIAQLASGEQARSAGGKLELQVTRIAASSGPAQKPQDAPTRFHPGDQLQVRVHNRGIDDVWVTLLFLSADHGIQVWLSAVLQAGSQFVDGGTVDASSLGPEGFIVFAVPVRSQKAQPNYEFLQQDGLSVQTRDVRAPSNRPLDPFEQLMSAAAFGKSQHRGLRRKLDSTPQVLTWSWLTAVADHSASAPVSQ